MYIIFEGVDTSGKSTQIQMLKKIYPDFIYTKEPGATLLGEKLREIILHDNSLSQKAELFLFLADRAQHYEEVICPNLGKNTIISDRGFISGIAYASVNHKTYNLDFLIELNRFATKDKKPDLVVLFKTNKTLIKQRLSQKKLDGIEKRGIDYLLKVQDVMQKLLEILQINYKIIDSSKSIDEINKQIRGFIT